MDAPTQKQEKQVMSDQQKARSFQENDCVIVRNYSYGPKSLKGVVLSVDGSLMYAVELESRKVVERHVDHMEELYVC